MSYTSVRTNNIRSAIQKQINVTSDDNVGAVQFLNLSADGSRQGNRFLSGAPGYTQYSSGATFGVGPVDGGTIAGA